MSINLLFLISLIFFCIFLWFKTQKTKKKRANLLAQKFPDEWVKTMQNKVYLYSILPVILKTQLHNLMKIFLGEKQFIGKENLEITEEMKLTIACQACLLLLHNRSNYFPYLNIISVYPDTIVLKDKKRKKDQRLIGQSSVGNKAGYDGEILLSWADVELESKLPNTGKNVVLHEFAHQLDQEFGSASGIPRLPNLQENLEWSHILSQEYKQLCEDVKLKKKTVLDEYGATNEAEFFAVATETFFTKPMDLKNKHFELYEQLKKYYQLNPWEWLIINN